MREPLELVVLPDARREEVAERFERALAPFGPMLAGRLRHGKWRIWTLVPEGLYEPEISLDYGYYDPDVDDPKFVLATWIGEFLRQRPGRIAIFENDPAHRDDPWLLKCTARTTYLGDRVYHYAASGASADEIFAVIQYAKSASWGMGAVVDSSSTDLPEDISADDLNGFASKAVSLICDAFDGVSIIVAEMADGLSIVPGHSGS